MSSQKTNNLGLHQWGGKDYVNMNEFNDNFAKLDNEVAKKADAAAIEGVAKKQTEFTAQLAETEDGLLDTKRADMYFWQPPVQPPARTDTVGYFVDAFRVTYNDFINNYLEPLRLSEASYISRTNMGKDSSGMFDVWRYEFTPKNFKKTIIIDAAIHGGEITSTLMTYRFMYHLVRDWQKYPQLGDIRQNVRIIYTPVANPWGFENRTRHNANGVDINRNFSFGWDEYKGASNPFELGYKGSTPFSEVESQYIRTTLQTYKEAHAYLSFHNTGTPDYDVYTHYAKGMKPYAYDDLVQYWVKGKSNPVIIYSEMNDPTSGNYGFNVVGIPSSNPEWSDRKFGIYYSSEDLTKCLEWYGNIIIEHSRVYDNEPFTKEQYYTPTVGNEYATNAYLNEITAFKDYIYTPSDGHIIYRGSVTVSLASGTGELLVVPMLGQGGNGLDAYPTKQTDKWGIRVTLGAVGNKMTIPFVASIPVKRKTTSSAVVEAGFGLAVQSPTGVYKIHSYRAVATFIPSKFENWKVKQITM